MPIAYSDPIDSTSERQTGVAVAALKAAQATQLASLEASFSLTKALVGSQLSVARFIARATASTFGLAQQQAERAKQLTPSKRNPVAPNAPLVTTDDRAAQAASRKIVGDAARAAAAGSAAVANYAAQAASPPMDDVAPAVVMTTDASPKPVTTADEDQELELRAERLVVNKQSVQRGTARVRKEIVTDIQSIDVPVSHEELVIDRQPATGDGDVDSEPMADETIRIPLTEEQVNITKNTVVREEVEFGKRRVEDVEHISDTVRHEELRVNGATTNYQPAL